MKKAIKTFFKIKGPTDIGQKLFLLGLFFLPTALPITGLLFIASLLISFKFNRLKIFNSKVDLGLFISLTLFFLSSINNTLINVPKELINEDKTHVWTGLLNWAPMIIFYWGFKPFLKTASQRIISLKFFISGSLPVLISFVLQIFSFYGPHKTFFNLIIWFNKPINEIGGYTGLFSNPNYAGIFLVLILPFLFYLFKEEQKENLISKFILSIYILMTIFFVITTNSRNALVGLIISFFTLININKFSRYFLIGTASFIVFINYLTNFFNQLKSKIYFDLLPFCQHGSDTSLFCKLIYFNAGLENPRIRIWLSTLSIIKDRPIWGWGSSTFSKVLPYKNIVAIPYQNLDIQHSHNIILEIAHNFGIPAALVIMVCVTSILFESLNHILIKQNKNFLNYYLNRAWIISLIIILFSQLFDITYYDGKISLIFVILLAGAKCIIEENSKLINNCS